MRKLPDVGFVHESELKKSAPKEEEGEMMRMTKKCEDQTTTMMVRF